MGYYILIFYSAHIGVIAQLSLFLSYIASAGGWNDGTPQFILRTKIEDGIKKKKSKKQQQTETCETRFYTPTLFLFSSLHFALIIILSSFSELCP